MGRALVMLLWRKSHQTSVLVWFTARLKAFVGLDLAMENSRKRMESGEGKMEGRLEGNDVSRSKA